MTIALVSHVGIAGATGGGTSSAINTTGATLLVMTAAMNVGSTQPTPTDSYGNTWLQVVKAAPGSAGYSVMFYVFNPTVGTGHTFTFLGTFSATQISAWSGVTTTNTPLEGGYVGATGSSSTLQPGSITPNQNGSLIITAYALNGVTGTSSINDSFTISDQEAYANSVNYGGGQAYLIQTTAAAINPTWTFGGSGTNAATIAAFGATPTYTPIENLSKFVGYSVLNQTDERLTKLVGYSVLNQTDERLTKLVSYVVMTAVVMPTPPKMQLVRKFNTLFQESEDREYQTKLEHIIQQKIRVGQPLISNASANISGVYGTGAPGTLVSSEILNFSGVHGTAEIGNLVGGGAIIAGVYGTAAVGSISIASQPIISGVHGTGATGTIHSSIIDYPEGVAGTGEAEGPLIVGQVLSGVHGTGEVGTMSLSISDNILILGVHGTGAAQSVSGRIFSSVHGTGVAEDLSGVDFFIPGVAGTGVAGDVTTGQGLISVYGIGEAAPLYILATLHVTNVIREILTTDATDALHVTNALREILMTDAAALRITNVIREVLVEDNRNALRVTNVVREVLLTGGNIISTLLVVT